VSQKKKTIAPLNGHHPRCGGGLHSPRPPPARDARRGSPAVAVCGDGGRGSRGRQRGIRACARGGAVVGGGSAAVHGIARRQGGREAAAAARTAAREEEKGWRGRGCAAGGGSGGGGGDRAQAAGQRALRRVPAAGRRRRRLELPRADGGGAHGESFLCVYWVAVPKRLRARRVNRCWRSTGARPRRSSRCVCAPPAHALMCWCGDVGLGLARSTDRNAPHQLTKTALLTTRERR
jgi:hypothetical protein